MTILQLCPTIPLETPLGPGQAIMVIDYSSEHHLVWTVIIDSTGEIWSFPNPKVRGQKNITMGRMINKEDISIKEFRPIKCNM
jgi:hypothetical protein